MQAAARVRNDSTRDRYQKQYKVGEGTYAVVYVGIQKDTGRKIAIKKIKVGQFKDGLDMSAIREVKFLQELRHPNIIELIDVFSSKHNLNLVLEYLSADLEMLIKDKSIIFQPADVKSWMLMTLRGLHHCHRNYVIHRDLKPNNLLLSPTGHLKLADFGLARTLASPSCNPPERMTPTVVTRWYRAPELLLGSRHYTLSIDIWSIGCIFAELMLRTPYLPGDSDLNQLDTIFKALGSPTDESWPDVKFLPDYFPPNKYDAPSKTEISNRFIAASDDAIQLMNSMLVINPAKRITTEDALLSPYFLQLPPPTKPENLPKLSIQTDNDDINPSLNSTSKSIKKNPSPTSELKKVARKLDF